MKVTEFIKVAQLFLWSELSNIRQFEIPWKRRLWLYRHGFLSSKDAVWDVTDDTVDQYLSDFAYRKLGRIDRPFSTGLKNKVPFHLIVSSTHRHLLPAVYGIIRHGRFYDTGRPVGLRSFDQLLDILRDNTVVAKPVNAAKGDDVLILEWNNGEVQLNGRAIEEKKLISHLANERDLLLQDYVSQAKYAADIYPASANTLRLITMIDPETGEPFIAAGTHRFGTKTSGFIDNWSAGGISAGIDLDTGELQMAVSPPTDGENMVEPQPSHPDTGAWIAGTVIPNWERIETTILDLALEYDWLWPHVGWDLIVQNDQGDITVLEGDPRSIDADQQAHGPLLTNPRVRQFYEHYGVLSDNDEANR